MMDIDAKINDLLSKGALEIAGVDEKSGEILYKVTSIMKKVDPELFAEHENTVHTETMYLWENGFLDIDVTEDNPIVKLTPLAFDEKAIIDLPIDKRISLEDIKSILMDKK